MKIHPMTLGMYAVNNYLVYSEASRNAILIDACEDANSILQEISRLELTVKYLINTHGHADHMAGNETILKETGATLMAHPLDVEYLTNPMLNLSVMTGMGVVSPEPDQLLNEGDTVELDDLKFEIIHTPGHAPGHISLIAEEVAFVGDVIFYGSIGRTDFPGGSLPQLEATIREKIYVLPDDMVLYNGHGPETTVGHEKQFNPFVPG